jgi:hypothetical protein
MPKTTHWGDCERWAKAITACGGRLRAPLAGLLSSHAVLAAPTRSERAEQAIIDSALNGELTAETLQRLAPKAASASVTNAYLADLARRSENVLVGAWHRVLQDGGADEVIASLQSNFTKHADAIATARTLISAESTAEAVIQSGEPALVRAWQQLDGHIRAVNQIAAIAAHFGCRPQAQFPQVVEYAQGETFRIDDRAVMCTDGEIVRESGLFARPDQGHRTSPWFKTALKLHSISEAQERYNRWAADEFDRVHSGPRGGWIDENGQMREWPAPENPYRKQKVST